MIFGGQISYLNSNVEIFFARCARGVPILPFPTFDTTPRNLANFPWAYYDCSEVSTITRSVIPCQDITLFLFCVVLRKVGNKLLLPCEDLRQDKPTLDGAADFHQCLGKYVCVFSEIITENIWWRVSERIYYVLHVCIASQLNTIRAVRIVVLLTSVVQV